MQIIYHEINKTKEYYKTSETNLNSIIFFMTTTA